MYQFKIRFTKNIFVFISITAQRPTIFLLASHNLAANSSLLALLLVEAILQSL